MYVGSDVGKWGEFERACDYTQIINNTIGILFLSFIFLYFLLSFLFLLIFTGPNVAAEAIDIKEGSSFTLVKGNLFNASGKRQRSTERERER